MRVTLLVGAAATTTAISLGVAPGTPQVVPSILGGISQQDEQLFRCTAAILADGWAITSAHCEVDTGFSLTLDRKDMYDYTGGHTVDIAEVIRHPKYDPVTRGSDLALVRFCDTDEDEEDGTNTQSGSGGVKGKFVEISTDQSDRVKGVIAVWDKVAVIDGEISKSLTHRVVKSSRGKECAKYANGVSNNSSVCVERVENEGCQEPAGTPLFVYKDGLPQLSALATWPLACGEQQANNPGLYTSVSAHTEWIQQTIKSSDPKLCEARAEKRRLQQDFICREATDCMSCAGRLQSSKFGEGQPFYCYWCPVAGRCLDEQEWVNTNACQQVRYTKDECAFPVASTPSTTTTNFPIPPVAKPKPPVTNKANKANRAVGGGGGGGGGFTLSTTLSTTSTIVNFAEGDNGMCAQTASCNTCAGASYISSVDGLESSCFWCDKSKKCISTEAWEAGATCGNPKETQQSCPSRPSPPCPPNQARCDKAMQAAGSNCVLGMCVEVNAKTDDDRCEQGFIWCENLGRCMQPWLEDGLTRPEEFAARCGKPNSGKPANPLKGVKVPTQPPPPGIQAPPTVCGTSGGCPPMQFCTQTAGISLCRAYAKEGDECGGNFQQRNEAKCGPGLVCKTGVPGSMVNTKMCARIVLTTNKATFSPTLAPTNEPTQESVPEPRATSTCNSLRWPLQPGKTVCANSSPNDVCPLLLKHGEAFQFCAGAGGRICTLSELQEGIATGSGCKMDNERVWAADACGRNGHMTAGGSPSAGWPAICEQPEVSYRVRCCADQPTRTGPALPPAVSKEPQTCDQLGWPTAGDGICSNSVFPNGACLTDVDHDNAKSSCLSIGGRLCSSEEILKNHAKGSGCKLDTARVWTNTPCNGGVITLLGASDVGSLMCSKHTEGYGVRCCSSSPTNENNEVILPDSESRTCDQLGWDITGDVCASSKIAGMCSGQVSYRQAEAFCGYGGGRICTSAELSSAITVGTGCKLDRERVWSSTPCGAGHYDTQAGDPSKMSLHPLRCDNKDRLMYVRCCADKGN